MRAAVCPTILKQIDRLANSFHRNLPERLGVDETLCHPHHIGGAVDCAGRRHLLHARREMDGWADRVVIDRKIVMDRPNQHLAGVQANPDGDVGIACRANTLLHVERRVGGAHGIVLVRKRRTEQRHDAVALHPVDRTLIAMDGIDHRIQRRPQPQLGVFRIEILDQGPSSP